MSKAGVKRDVLDALEDKAPWLEESLVFLTYHGSQAYGTKTEYSDTDIKGVFVPSLETISDPYVNMEQLGCHHDDLDILIFDIRKFLKLAAGGNPGVLEYMWIDEEDWIYSGRAWRLIHDHRDLFLSKEACKRFLGYAAGELGMVKKGINKGPGPTTIRRELYEKYGYDSKAAAHAMRLSRMARELASKEVFQVKRPDAKELLDIRNGRCSIDKVLLEIEDNIKAGVSAMKTSHLLDEIDQDVVRAISLKIMDQHLYGDT
jgi:hypothetical protein